MRRQVAAFNGETCLAVKSADLSAHSKIPQPVPTAANPRPLRHPPRELESLGKIPFLFVYFVSLCRKKGPVVKSPATFARDAMATRFEIVLPGDDPVRLRAAAEEAFDEIDRLERQLSLYIPTSEIAAVNARAAREPIRVSPETMRVLQHAARLSAETGGAFDPTIAPLMRAWGFLHGSGHPADPEQLAAARACVGMNLVELNPAAGTVRFTRSGMMLDLGAIGKGYAVDRAAALLREAGIASALIHGGTSTAYALGHPPDNASWRITLEYPRQSPEAPPPLANFDLSDESLSVSAVWGKSFEAGGRRFGHVLDPRTGQPAQHAVLAAVASGSATETDALSTALLTLGLEDIGRIATLRPGARALAVAEDAGHRFRVASRGVGFLAQT